MHNNSLKTESWKKYIHEWRLSRQTASEWCGNHTVNYKTFLYWKYKLEGKRPKAIPEGSLQTTSFVELSDSLPQTVGFELTVNGVTVHLHKNFDATTLKSTLLLLRKL